MSNLLDMVLNEQIDHKQAEKENAKRLLSIMCNRNYVSPLEENIKMNLPSNYHFVADELAKKYNAYYNYIIMMEMPKTFYNKKDRQTIIKKYKRFCERNPDFFNNDQNEEIKIRDVDINEQNGFHNS